MAGPTAAPLVLLPGMNCSARLWSPMAGILRGGGVLVVEEAVEGADLATCVHSLLERLPPRFVLAGLSLGGIVAMAIHRVAPERVAGLGLLATSPLPPTRAQLASWERTVRALEEGTSARTVQEDLLPGLLHPDAHGRLGETVLAMADDVGSATLSDQLRLQADRVDERPGLRHVRVPTLVVGGSDDLVCPPDRQQLIHRLVGAPCELVLLPRTGHLCTLERPAEVAEALLGLMRRVATETPPRGAPATP